MGVVGGDEAGLLAGVADVFDGALDVVAVLAAAGEVAAGHEGETGEAGDACAG